MNDEVKAPLSFTCVLVVALWEIPAGVFPSIKRGCVRYAH